MSRQANLAERVELSLIAEDAIFFGNLTLNPSLQATHGVTILPLIPSIATFLFESAEYLKGKYPTAAQEPAVIRMLELHREVLYASRLRLKLADDNEKYRSFTDILETAYELIATHNDWLLGKHSGILGPLKRLLQSDLGICYMDNNVISTTHNSFLNLGLTREKMTTTSSSLSWDALGPYLRDNTAKDYGAYLGWLLNHRNLITYAAKSGPEVSLDSVRFLDVKSKRFYESMASQVAPDQIPVCILMTGILSQVNTARILVPELAGQNEVAALKIRFLSLYHAAVSLQKLLDKSKNSTECSLSTEAVHIIQPVLDENSVQRVCEERHLRNTFMHYGVPKWVAQHLSSNLPLGGFVEAHTNGKAITDIAYDVELGLEAASHGLRPLLPERL